MHTDFIAVDLTSHSPHWIDAEGESGPVHPVFCLPIHKEEPPLTGKAARVHRRGTLPQEHPSESYLDPNNRSRYHLAEGWIRLSLNPDSLHPANTNFQWTPPGEKEIRSSKFEDVLIDILTPFASRTSTLGLVVPGRLGPGPRQQVLDCLKTRFKNIHLIPRPIAIALDWLNENDQSISTEDLPPGRRAGNLLVANASPDYWEIATIPLRVEKRGEINTVVPVHDRTRVQGDLLRVGLAWDMACRRGESEFDRFHGLLMNPTQTAIVSLTRQIYEECLNYLAPEGVHTTDDDSVKMFLEEVKSTSTTCLYAGYLEAEKAPQWIQALLPCDTPTTLDSPEQSGVRGVRQALDLLRSKSPPYYEALSPLHLYVHGRNEYEDPVEEWQKLIEATEVPANKLYKSPKPITGLELQPHSDDDIPLCLKLERSGNISMREGAAPVFTALEKPTPLEVEATMQPGQGLATVEIRSRERGLFLSYLRLDRLNECSGPPEITYAWPPGSSCVISADDVVKETFPKLLNFLEQSRHGFPDQRDFRDLRNILNKWVTPEAHAYRLWNNSEENRSIPVPDEFQKEFRQSLDIPRGVHESFVYVGAVPSGTNPFIKPMDQLIPDLALALVDLLQQVQNNTERDKVLWLASWLYLWCPEPIIEMARNSLTSPQLPTGPTLASAGQCFSKEKDFKLFFERFARETRGPNRGRLDPATWLRAYRNLARFRPKSLRVECFSKEDQQAIFDWYIRKFRASPKTSGSSFLHSAYLAPQILKRRRYDPHFLDHETDNYSRFDEVLAWAEKSGESEKHRENAAVAREFLSKTATQSTIKRLSDVEGSS